MHVVGRANSTLEAQLNAMLSVIGYFSKVWLWACGLLLLTPGSGNRKHGVNSPIVGNSYPIRSLPVCPSLGTSSEARQLFCAPFLVHAS